MKRLLLCLMIVVFALLPSLPAQPSAPLKLLIAFSSYRERPKHPNIFFYEHDGVANGKIVGSVGTPRGADAACKPALSQDGRYCVFTFEIENQTSKIKCWDRKEQKLVELPAVNDSPNALLGPSVSGDGKLIALAGWNRPGGPGPGYHVYLYDKPAKKLLELPGLNSQAFDDRMPALSGDGRFLAFASNRKGGAGLTDLYLYDRKDQKLVDMPGLNSKYTELEPSLNVDGRLIAFTSERDGGAGGRDIYLFDRGAGRFVPLPGLNTPAHEYSPSLSPDGRFIAFVSERVEGEGERDIYLYDRATQKLLPTPGLNSKTEDFDPCVILLKASE
jgi:dipeptidyl aminopeptidase/acylaminoacyl peptidase